MPEAERSVQISRPIDEVFAFFADSENDPKWRRHVKSIERIGPIGPGAKYKQQIAGPGGRGIPSDFTVTTYQPPTSLAFQVTAGPVRPTGTYQLEPSADGTNVTLRLQAQLSGLKNMLLGRAVQKSMDSEVASLDRAKQLLEGAG